MASRARLLPSPGLGPPKQSCRQFPAGNVSANRQSLVLVVQSPVQTAAEEMEFANRLCGGGHTDVRRPAPADPTGPGRAAILAFVVIDGVILSDREHDQGAAAPGRR